jgi:nitrogen fixation protein NifB
MRERMTVKSERTAAALATTHPCYTEAAGLRYGRIHLSVAARCNLGCNFCERTIGPKAKSIGGPGTAERLISPDDAAARVDAIRRLGWLHVVGIAGPAEPLASRETFETLRLVHTADPDLVLCLSTNGLNLAEILPYLLDVGLRALTITINTTDPDTAAQLYAWAELDGERVPGREAASEILARQWRGLEAAVGTGLLIKVNSVYVPGVNERDLVAVARRASAIGAHRHNIMPLIPRGNMRNLPAPSRAALESVRLECEAWIDQFRGCTQCPADVIEPPTGKEARDACGRRDCRALEVNRCGLTAS